MQLASCLVLQPPHDLAHSVLWPLDFTMDNLAMSLKCIHGQEPRQNHSVTRPQAAQAPDKITRERDSIERYNGLNL